MNKKNTQPNPKHESEMQKLADTVTERIKSILEAGLMSLLQKNDGIIDRESTLSALEAIQDYRNLVSVVARKVRRTFSEEYIEKAVISLLFDIIENANKANIEETVKSRVVDFVGALMSFDKEYEIYVPLDGLSSSAELGELHFGNAVLIQMDADRFSKLQQMLISKEDRIGIEDKRKKLRDLERIKDGFEEQVIMALKSGDEKCESYYRKKKLEIIEKEITPIVEALKTSMENLSRLQIPTESLKDTFCARYRFSAESSKAIEYAEHEQLKMLPLLRYAISIAQMRDTRAQDRQSDTLRMPETALAIASDATDFQVVGGKMGTRHPFEITSRHVGLMQEAGIFEMAKTFSGSHGKLNEIEAMIQRCINWFSLSQTQPDKATEFLSLVIVLEILLTSSDKTAPISTTISEAVAILLADSEQDRQETRMKMRKIYTLRSNVVHGNSTPNQVEFDEYLTDLRNMVMQSITQIWKLKAAGRFKENKKEDLTGLINSIKFKGPSIQDAEVLAKT